MQYDSVSTLNPLVLPTSTMRSCRPVAPRCSRPHQPIVFQQQIAHPQGWRARQHRPVHLKIMVLNRRHHRLTHDPSRVQQGAKGPQCVATRPATIIVFHLPTTFIVATFQGHFHFGAVYDMQPASRSEFGRGQWGGAHIVAVPLDSIGIGL